MRAIVALLRSLAGAYWDGSDFSKEWSIPARWISRLVRPKGIAVRRVLLAACAPVAASHRAKRSGAVDEGVVPLNREDEINATGGLQRLHRGHRTCGSIACPETAGYGYWSRILRVIARLRHVRVVPIGDFAGIDRDRSWTRHHSRQGTARGSAVKLSKFRFRRDRYRKSPQRQRRRVQVGTGVQTTQS